MGHSTAPSGQGTKRCGVEQSTERLLRHAKRQLLQEEAYFARKDRQGTCSSVGAQDASRLPELQQKSTKKASGRATMQQVNSHRGAGTGRSKAATVQSAAAAAKSPLQLRRRRKDTLSAPLRQHSPRKTRSCLVVGAAAATHSLAAGSQTPPTVLRTHQQLRSQPPQQARQIILSAFMHQAPPTPTAIEQVPGSNMPLLSEPAANSTLPDATAVPHLASPTAGKTATDTDAQQTALQLPTATVVTAAGDGSSRDAAGGGTAPATAPAGTCGTMVVHKGVLAQASNGGHLQPPLCLQQEQQQRGRLELGSPSAAAASGTNTLALQMLTAGYSSNMQQTHVALPLSNWVQMQQIMQQQLQQQHTTQQLLQQQAQLLTQQQLQLEQLQQQQQQSQEQRLAALGRHQAAQRVTAINGAVRYNPPATDGVRSSSHQRQPAGELMQLQLLSQLDCHLSSRSEHRQQQPGEQTAATSVDARQQHDARDSRPAAVTAAANAHLLGHPLQEQLEQIDPGYQKSGHEQLQQPLSNGVDSPLLRTWANAAAAVQAAAQHQQAAAPSTETSPPQVAVESTAAAAPAANSAPLPAAAQQQQVAAAAAETNPPAAAPEGTESLHSPVDAAAAAVAAAAPAAATAAAIPRTGSPPPGSLEYQQVQELLAALCIVQGVGTKDEMMAELQRVKELRDFPPSLFDQSFCNLCQTSLENHLSCVVLDALEESAQAHAILCTTCYKAASSQHQDESLLPNLHADMLEGLHSQPVEYRVIQHKQLTQLSELATVIDFKEVPDYNTVYQDKPFHSAAPTWECAAEPALDADAFIALLGCLSKQELARRVPVASLADTPADLAKRVLDHISKDPTKATHSEDNHLNPRNYFQCNPDDGRRTTLAEGGQAVGLVALDDNITLAGRNPGLSPVEKRQLAADLAATHRQPLQLAARQALQSGQLSRAQALLFWDWVIKLRFSQQSGSMLNSGIVGHTLLLAGLPGSGTPGHIDVAAAQNYALPLLLSGEQPEQLLHQPLARWLCVSPRVFTDQQALKQWVRLLAAQLERRGRQAEFIERYGREPGSAPCVIPSSKPGSNRRLTTARQLAAASAAQNRVQAAEAAAQQLVYAVDAADGPALSADGYRVLTQVMSNKYKMTAAEMLEVKDVLGDDAIVIDQCGMDCVNIRPGWMHFVVNLRPCLKVAFERLSVEDVVGIAHMSRLRSRFVGLPADYEHTVSSLVSELSTWHNPFTQQ